ncbi:MAG: hypothetical protein CMH86_06360 [Oceanibulbus sp.]|nr:hypothetical protein [Sulfitobacter sp.]
MQFAAESIIQAAGGFLHTFSSCPGHDTFAGYYSAGYMSHVAPLYISPEGSSFRILSEVLPCHFKIEVPEMVRERLNRSTFEAVEV